MYKETVLKISMYYQHVIDVNKKDLKKGKLSMNRRYIERSQMFLVCFILTANGRYKKIISLVPKGEESQQGDRNVKQASLSIQNSYHRFFNARICVRIIW